MSDESPLSDLQICAFLQYLHIAKKVRSTLYLSSLLLRALMSFTSAPLSWLNCLPNVPHPNNITLANKASTYEFCGTQTSVHSSWHLLFSMLLINGNIVQNDSMPPTHFVYTYPRKYMRHCHAEYWKCRQVHCCYSLSQSYLFSIMIFFPDNVYR